MSEQSSDTVNLDLNLVPDPDLVPISGEPTNSNDWVEPFNRIRETMRLPARQRSRWRQAQIPNEIHNIPVELNEVMVNTGNESTLQANPGSGSTLQGHAGLESTLQTGEGSVGSEERILEVSKICDSTNGLPEEASEKNENDEKGSGSDGSFFDCNICFDLAKEPVVTCCGHLFCWPCLYQWFDHSGTKECPVCKGEVTMKNLIPIYGRGKDVREDGEDSTPKIPQRPQARRVESLRQTYQRAAFRFPVEELIRHLSSRPDVHRDTTSHHTDGMRDVADGMREVAERSDSLLERLMTPRGLRREENPVQASDDLVDLTQGETSSETGPAQRIHSLLFRRSLSNRAAAEVETYVLGRSLGRNQELTPPVDDRDSFSSIAAVINSESQTIDTAAEIDSTVLLSTSSSRRRSDAPRAPEMDRGSSRPRRRRRLN